MTTSQRPFEELIRLEALIQNVSGRAKVERLATVSDHSREYPIYSLEFGSEDLSKPVLLLVGGVHGLERIGTQLVLTYLEHLSEIMLWDEDTQHRLKEVRIVAIPLLNPGGMALGQRSNPRGVDLMRNAPIEAKQPPGFLVGGHRYSKLLPWYRGEVNDPMEVESHALCTFVRDRIFPSKACLVLDVHSGFGSIDRLWYPYAKTYDDFPKLKEVERLTKMLNRTYPNHVYHVESQSKSYTTHGDLWDYLFDEFQEKFAGQNKVFIPWTLEMGSWIWIRKNPAQLFSALGVFNPIKAHRFRRIMRRHLPLIDFFLKAVKNHAAWSEVP